MLLISRPRFWLYTAGPYLVATAFANPLYLTNPLFYLQFLLFLIPANFFIYGINDIFDTDTDTFNLKKRTKEVMGTNRNWIYIFSSFLLFIPYFFFLDNIGKLILGLFLLVSFAYSAPPFRFKKYPFIDAISNVLYILPALLAYWQHTQTLIPIHIFIAMWFWVIAMHMYSAVPDIVADTKAKLLTTPVLIGKTGALVLCGALWLSATILTQFWIGLVYPIMIILSFKFPLTKLYWYFPYINAAVGAVLFFSAIIPALIVL